MPGPDTHQLVIPSPCMTLERRRGTFGYPQGGYPTDACGQSCSAAGGGSLLTPLTGLLRIMGSTPSVTGGTGKKKPACHLSHICLLQLIPHFTEGLTVHLNYLSGVCPQVDPVKYPHKDVKYPLHPLQSCGDKEAIVSIEKNHTIHPPSEAVGKLLYCHHHRKPVPDHGIHHHV